jgi:hypothetical protein
MAMFIFSALNYFTVQANFIPNSPLDQALVVCALLPKSIDKVLTGCLWIKLNKTTFLA